MRVVKQAGHRLGVAVEQLSGEDGLQVFFQGQVQRKVQGVLMRCLRQFGDVFLLERLVLRQSCLHHMHLVPFVVEQTEGGGLCQLGFHRLAK